MAMAAFDIFLKLDGFKGEATVRQTAGTGSQYPLTFTALDAGSASAGLLEEVALHYARIQWEYRLVGKGGAPGPVVKAGWDLATNQKI